MTIIDILRHGELEGGDKYRGTTDDPLTREGRADMEAVWQCLKGEVDVVVASPLQRCRLPAEAWARDASIPFHLEPRFREMEYGAWEGLSREEIEARFPGQLEHWRDNPVGMRIPGAEHVDDFARRVREGWFEVVQRFRGRHVLVVAHSGSIRMILATALDAPIQSTRHFRMCYSCWSRIRADAGFLTLEFFNRQSFPQ